MKCREILPALVLGLALILAGCAASPAALTPGSSPEVPSDSPSLTPQGRMEEGSRMVCRLMDVSETGQLTLAALEEDTGYGVYTAVAPEGADLAALGRGMAVTVVWSGEVMESYPAQLGTLTALEEADVPADHTAQLCLQVLEDLWEVDSGLNCDITLLGMDLSAFDGLTENEKAAVTWLFGCAHGLPTVTGTWQELVDQGYIDGEELYWEEGCLFSITGSAESFSAEKWRSGLGAYLFLECEGEQDGEGNWTYTVGAEAIA